MGLENLRQQAPALTVQFSGFEGSLPELAEKLRSGYFFPVDIPLITITEQVLSAFYTLGAEHSESLPLLAKVLWIKTRLLLPKPPTTKPEPEEEFYQESLDSLAELASWVEFLQHKRQSRSQIVPVGHVVLPKAPRPAPAQNSLAKLLKIAKDTIRDIPNAHLAKERLTLSHAKHFLLRKLRQLGWMKLSDLGQNWAELGVYFGAMLESVRLGEIEAEQSRAFADIDLQYKKPQ